MTFVTIPVLFPASLIGRRRRWQERVQRASETGWLLVVDQDNPKQTSTMMQLGKSLERQGKRVDVLSVGKWC